MRRMMKVFFLAAALALASQSVLAAVFTPGPQDTPSPPGHNFPRWYTDPVRGTPPPTGGLPLELCLSQTPSPSGPPMCILLTDGPPDTFVPTNPIAFTTNGLGQFNGNFPGESFYFIADAIILDIGGGNRARYRAALEAAFGSASGLPEPGQQITFARVRWDVAAPVNGTYRITHPFGQRVFPNVVAGPAAINIQEDIGVGLAGGPFSPITTTNQPDGNLGQFLVRSATPGGQPSLITVGNEVFIGDPNIDQNVTGATFPDPDTPGQFFNRFRVEIDANNDGIFEQSFTTANFALAGKVIGFTITPAAGTDFAVQQLGVASAPKSFTVTNLSAAPVTPTVASSNPEFAVSVGNCGAAVAGGGSCTFAVTFTPLTTDGPRTANLTVSGAALPTATLPVSGIGDSTVPVVILTAPANNNFTNDTTPLLTYAVTDANPNSAATVVTVDGGVLNPTPASGTSLATLADGPHTVRVDATDLAGNTAFAQNSFTVDTVPPTASIAAPTNNSLINTRTPVLTYTVADDRSLATTVVKVDGVIVSPTPASGQNLASLADGLHTVRIEVTDSAGNSFFAQNSFTVDASAPVIAIAAPVTGSFTADNTPLITFSVSDANPNPAATVVKVDGVVVAKLTGSSLEQLADGSHTLRIEATDNAGNGAFLESSFTVDIVAPIPVITSPANSGFTTDPGPLLAFSITDANPGSSVVRLDGVIVNIVAGQHLTNLTDGQHRVGVDHSDAAGNTGFSEAVFVVDTIAPTVAINSPAVGTLTGDTTPLLVFTATDTNTLTIVVKVDGTPVNGVISGQSLPTLADGPHVVRVEATDAAGNLSFAEAAFNVDSAFPIIELTSPLNGSLSKNTAPLLAFTATDAHGIATTVVKIDGAVVQKGSGDPLGPLSDGVHTIRVEVTDAANNTAVALATITIDTVPPALGATAAATNRKMLLVSGTVESGLTVTGAVTSGSATLGQIITTGTSWSATISGLVPGANTISVSATDAAGNIATQNATITYVVPDGDNNGAGGVTIVDVLRVLRHVANLAPLSGTDLLRADVAPLNNGVPDPDNTIDIGDAAITLRKAVGLITSF